MGIYLLFRRSEWKSGLKFWRFCGGRANKKRPRLTAKGDAAHRGTTLLRPGLTAKASRSAGTLPRGNGRSRSGLTVFARPDGS